MPSKIDISALTLNPEEALAVSELVLERGFINGVLSDNHEILTGVQWQKQIQFVSQLPNSLRAHTACTPTEGDDIVLTQKFWDPQKFGTRLTHCADDLDLLYKTFGKASRFNPDFYDIISSPAGQLLMARTELMLETSLPVIAWFQDTNADVFPNPGGTFTPGTDLTLYNLIDGLWPQIRAEVGPGNDNYVEITQNTGLYATQFLTPQEAFDYLTAMVNQSDERLIGDPDRKLYLSRSFADPYRDYLRDNTIGNGFIDITEDGKLDLRFDGIPIEIMYVWDRTIRADQNDTITGSYFQPIRGLLTTPDNIPAATLSTSDLDEVDAFYDRTLKQSIFDIVFNLDVKFLEDYRAVAAY